MDYALAPPIVDALRDAVEAGLGGYPAFDIGGELGVVVRRVRASGTSGTRSTPSHVLPVVDVTAGRATGARRGRPTRDRW